MSRVSGCDWYLVSIARTHTTEQHILHPLDTVSILYPLYMYLVTYFRQCTTHRGSPNAVGRTLLSSRGPLRRRRTREPRARRAPSVAIARQSPRRRHGTFPASETRRVSRSPRARSETRAAVSADRSGRRPSPFFYPRPRRRGRSAGRCASARDRGTICARRTTRELVGAFARPERDSTRATRSERFR